MTKVTDKYKIKSKIDIFYSHSQVDEPTTTAYKEFQKFSSLEH